VSNATARNDQENQAEFEFLRTRYCTNAVCCKKGEKARGLRKRISIKSLNIPEWVDNTLRRNSRLRDRFIEQESEETKSVVVGS